MVRKLRSSRLIFAALLGLFCCSLPVSVDVDSPMFDDAVADASKVVESALLETRRDDDLDAMLHRRVVRVLVTYSRTNFFLRGGEPAGFEYELTQQYRAHLKTRVRARSWPVTFVYIPVRFDQLLPSLLAGVGDIAAAGLTVTAARQQKVAFTDPYITDVAEVLVSARKTPPPRRLEDLAGRRIYVNTATSYAEHLRALNGRFADQGLPAIEIVPADPRLATEDILELVNANIVGLTVADSHIAAFWSAVLPDIVVHEDIKISQGGRIAWAVRPDNPELRASLNRSIKHSRQGTLIGNVLIDRYYGAQDFVVDPLAPRDRERLDGLAKIFRRYGERYGFDWLQLAAIGYQESRLDQSRKSQAGAIGVMQLLPSTAAAAPIEVNNIHRVENNIRAGAKYAAHLRDAYFADPKIAPTDRFDFVLAAYNAGPTRISNLREIARKNGFDPNRWAGNVEALARRRVGREPVEYVAKVNKYFIAYSLARERLQERERATDRLRRRGID